MRVGVFPMVADVLHAGHIQAIKEAKEHCDFLVVALHCNPEYKNPTQTIFERFMQLDAIRYVDKVIPYQNRSDAETLLSTLDYDVYFLGSDYKNKDFECKELVTNCLHKELYFLSRNHNLSSSELKRRIKCKEEEKE